MEFAFGVVLSLALGRVSRRIAHPELRRAVGATLALTLCGMQSSWIMTLGPTLLAFLIVGVGSMLVDRYWLRARVQPSLEAT